MEFKHWVNNRLSKIFPKVFVYKIQNEDWFEEYLLYRKQMSVIQRRIYKYNAKFKKALRELVKNSSEYSKFKGVSSKAVAEEIYGYVQASRITMHATYKVVNASRKNYGYDVIAKCYNLELDRNIRELLCVTFSLICSFNTWDRCHQLAAYRYIMLMFCGRYY